MKIDKNVLVKFLDLLFDEDTSDPYILYDNFVTVDMYQSHKYYENAKKLSEHRNIVYDINIIKETNLSDYLKMTIENNFFEFVGLNLSSDDDSPTVAISLEFENNDTAKRVIEIYHAIKNLIEAEVIKPIDSSFKEVFADRINDGTIL